MKFPSRRRMLGCTTGVAILLFAGWFVLRAIGIEVSISLMAAIPRDSARSIALGMEQYAKDHNGHYPTGSSSTEVFQKLLDDGYSTDPSVFAGFGLRPEAKSGERLKPENVAFDVTDGVDQNTRPGLPLVFLTGCRVEYKAGGRATELTTIYSGYPIRGWLEWWNRSPILLPTGFQGDVSHRTDFVTPPHGPRFVPNFVSENFDVHGQIYRQLTPEGVFK